MPLTNNKQQRSKRSGRIKILSVGFILFLLFRVNLNNLLSPKLEKDPLQEISSDNINMLKRQVDSAVDAARISDSILLPANHP